VKHAKKIGQQRQRRQVRVRNALKRHCTRPRLCVFRSHKHIAAQVIDDQAGKTLAAASTQDKDLRQSVGYGGNKNAASAIGTAIAQRAIAAGVKQVAFDRREYKYHGRVAALADAARDAGLDLGAKQVPPEPEAEKPAKGKKGEKAPKGEKAAKAEKGEKKPKTEKKPKKEAAAE
jgi:large subunit ribosomal protein L18